MPPGDTLLKRLAHVLSAAFRADDVLARIGGDEFAILLPNTGATEVKNALERVRRILDEHNARNAGPALEVSFGASTARKSTSLTDVLKEADESMYTENAPISPHGKNTTRKKAGWAVIRWSSRRNSSKFHPDLLKSVGSNPFSH